VYFECGIVSNPPVNKLDWYHEVFVSIRGEGSTTVKRMKKSLGRSCMERGGGGFKGK
jgi:hypothetical protein